MVSTFTQPDFTSQDGTTYKTAIDDSVSVLSRTGAGFAAHQQSTPDMTVRVDAGSIYDNGTQTLTEVAGQNTATITAPSTNPRIDRVVISSSTGAVSVITGTEAASPTAPAITSGNIPVAQIALTTSQSEIVNADITDERPYFIPAGASIDIATQGDMEAETVDKVVDASVVKYSPSALKAWVRLDGTGTIAIDSSYNIDSITDNGTGDVTVNIDVDMSSAANNCPTVSVGDGSGNNRLAYIASIAAGSARVQTVNGTFSSDDCAIVTIHFAGDQ